MVLLRWNHNFIIAVLLRWNYNSSRFAPSCAASHLCILTNLCGIVQLTFLGAIALGKAYPGACSGYR